MGILIWGVFLLVDYLRYDSGNPPIFAIKIVDDHYTDGEVREWVGLGYVYREYERVPIERVEFVPFWVLLLRVLPISLCVVHPAWLF